MIKNASTLSWLPSMTYRKAGKLEFEPSALGFGAMRLPTIGNKDDKIRHRQRCKLHRHSLPLP
jgi:predicted aldo/keto reductase-like oxidoreductase